MRPVPFKHGAAVRVYLDLPGYPAHPCAFKAQLKAAYHR